MTHVHGVARLTSSSGLMSCTALTSATVPLYVTITFGLQLWFIRATLPQTTTIKTLNYSKVFNILRSCNGFDFYEPYSGNTAEPKWDSSSSSMVKPLQFTYGVERALMPWTHTLGTFHEWSIWIGVKNILCLIFQNT